MVDEASQVELRDWAALQRYKLAGVKFVLVGDYQGQLHPVNDSTETRRRYEDADDIWRLVEGLHIQLTTYRRGTNTRYF